MWIIDLKQILWVRDHPKQRPSGGIGPGKETKTLNLVDVFTVQECMEKS
jgi:hypothetical protein